jgi:uncharacterized protein YodC (DUF2158 family)
MSKSKIKKQIEDFQIGMLVRLNTDEKNVVMSVHQIDADGLVWCDWLNDKGKPERNTYHYLQLEIV